MRTLTWFSSASSLLRFGAFSVLLHIGALAMLGALPGTHPMDTPRPLVTVTLLKPPAPVPKDMPPEETPPMSQAKRHERPVALHQVPPLPPHQLRPPPLYPTQATDVPPSPTRHAAPPVTRAPLSDQRAADALKAMPLETPPMLHAQRQDSPVALHQARPSLPPHQPGLLPPYPTQTTDIPPSPTRHAVPPVTRALLSDQRAADALNETHAAPPVTRELLSDQHASNALKLKNFTKVPARRTTPATNATAIPQEEQPLVIARLSTTTVRSLHEIPIPSPPATHPNAQAAPKVFRDTTADRTGRRTTARPVEANDPPYPHTARERGWEGTVMLRLTITREGAVEQATIRTSSGFPVLDESARQAVQAWKFEPARDGEFAIPAKVDVPVRFSLDNRHARDTP